MNKEMNSLELLKLMKLIQRNHGEVELTISGFQSKGEEEMEVKSVHVNDPRHPTRKLHTYTIEDLES